MADLILLKFTVKINHCPRFMLSFHSPFSLSLAFYKGSNCAQKTEVVEMNEISKFKFDLSRCLGTCHNVLQYENSHISFKMKNFVCFWNFLENAIF